MFRLATKKELDLWPTLMGGQSFLWQSFEKGYIGAICTDQWHFVVLEESNNDIMATSSASLSELQSYFRLDHDLSQLKKNWDQKDPYIQKTGYSAIRLLNQTPLETLLSFLCSQNNNIPRIRSLVQKLGMNYGQKLGSVQGLDVFSLPELSLLTKESIEQELRAIGFGYRAKYIHQAAKYVIHDKGMDWLESLRHESYSDAKLALLSIPGGICNSFN
jgi:N-glycosylase/DNA lyase